MDDQTRQRLYDQWEKYLKALKKVTLLFSSNAFDDLETAIKAILTADLAFANRVGIQAISAQDAQDIALIMGDINEDLSYLDELQQEANDSEQGFNALVDPKDPNSMALGQAFSNLADEISSDVAMIGTYYTYFIYKSLKKKDAKACIEAIWNDMDQCTAMDDETFYNTVAKPENISVEDWQEELRMLDNSNIDQAYKAAVEANS